jgi:hypothetical protein
VIAPHLLLRLRRNRHEHEGAPYFSRRARALLLEYRELVIEAAETAPEELAELARGAIRPGRDGRMDRQLYNFCCEAYQARALKFKIERN